MTIILIDWMSSIFLPSSSHLFPINIPNFFFCQQGRISSNGCILQKIEKNFSFFILKKCLISCMIFEIFFPQLFPCYVCGFISVYDETFMINITKEEKKERIIHKADFILFLSSLFRFFLVVDVVVEALWWWWYTFVIRKHKYRRCKMMMKYFQFIARKLNEQHNKAWHHIVEMNERASI